MRGEIRSAPVRGRMQGHRPVVPRQRSSDPRSLTRVAGLPAVSAVFDTAVDRVERLCFTPDLKRATAGMAARLAERRRPYREMEAAELARIAGTDMHGGVVAFVRTDPVREAAAAEFAGWARAREPLLVLDGVGNPQNIGAIARTAAFFGLKRLLISDHPQQSGLSDASWRIAKGGLSHVEVVRVRNLARMLEAAAKDYLVIGTALGGGQDLSRFDADRRPRLVVLGNEEDGLPRDTLAACQSVLTLPSAGPIQSLNVSVTAGVLIHALLRSS